MKKLIPLRVLSLLLFCLGIMEQRADAQGTWAPVSSLMPDFSGGVSLLLSDGTILVKACGGGTDTVGAIWDKLRPDTNGSYINGTWSRAATMHSTRLFCSSQTLRDGRVYMAGGEYGSGTRTAEIYNPVTDSWTTTAGPLTGGRFILDGNSEMLPDGRVLQNCVLPSSELNDIYNPLTDSFSIAPSCLGGADEAAWLLLPDNSVLFIDIDSKLSERYIPSLNIWKRDDTVPVMLYDPLGYEAGASFLLPDGRGFFIGSEPVTAYYTPSGDTANGRWAAGPAIPDSLGAVDAAASMMPNGKILCALSQQAVPDTEFLIPAWFYEFDYLTNSFTEVPACAGGDTMNIRCSQTGMLNLPDGNILMTVQNSKQVYVYQPGGAPLAAGMPVVNNITMLNCDTFMATGTLFNGISQGAAYGDDWQMFTNYPVIRLMYHDTASGSDYAYYARTFNWNSSGVMTGSQPDTTYFTLPAGLPYNTYNLFVVANGIASSGTPFTPCYTAGVPQVQNIGNLMNVYPNPATGQATVVFTSSTNSQYHLQLIDVLGQVVSDETGTSGNGLNNRVIALNGLAKGVYSVVLRQDGGVFTTKLVVE